MSKETSPSKSLKQVEMRAKISIAEGLSYLGIALPVFIGGLTHIISNLETIVNNTADEETMIAAATSTIAGIIIGIKGAYNSVDGLASLTASRTAKYIQEQSSTFK